MSTANIHETVAVSRTVLRTRNEETREWALVAKRDLPAGSFVACYSGFMGRVSIKKQSLYAVDMGHSQPTIIPFASEDCCISSRERARHPLCSANEPALLEHANMHLEPHDFAHREVEDVGRVYKHRLANFCRELAAFTCTDVKAGKHLTWHCGKRIFYCF